MILNHWDLSDRVWSVTKTKQDNDMTDHTSVVHTKNDVELSENLLDPFTKALTRKVFVGHKDSMSFK